MPSLSVNLPQRKRAGPMRHRLRLYGVVLLVLRKKLRVALSSMGRHAAAREQEALLVVSDKNSNTIKALIKTSHERPMDLNTSLPWHLGANKQLLPKRLEQSWIAGTPHWDALNPAQRLETVWLETARDISMFIHFEQLLPRLYMGYINEYEGRLPPEVTEYLMIFSKEEIVHSLAFKRFMKTAVLPVFPLSRKRVELLASLRHLHPCVGILCTLVIEWGAELVAMHGTQFADIDPLTRELFKQHHYDEVRHIGFACRLVEDYFKSQSESELRPIRQMLKEVLIPVTLEETSFNADIGRFTSFEFPVRAGDKAAIDAIRFSPRTRRLNADRFKDMYAWYGSMGLM